MYAEMENADWKIWVIWTRNYSVKVINQHDLMNLIELHSTLTNFSFCSYWISFNFCFCFFLWFSYGHSESCGGIKNLCITAGITKCKSILWRKKKRTKKMVLLAKTKLNTNLISRTLIDSSTSHAEFVLVNNVFKEYVDMKKNLIY